MLCKFVLVPLDGHRIFLSMLNCFQAGAVLLQLKAVQHRQKGFVTIKGDKHKLAQHNCHTQHWLYCSTCIGWT